MIVRVPVIVETGAASSITAVPGLNGLYVKVNEGYEGDAEITVVHLDGESMETVRTDSLAEGFYYVGAFPFGSSPPGSITVAGSGGGAVDSIMLAPAYPGAWQGEITAVGPRGMSGRLDPMGWGREYVEVYSLAGKKLHHRALFYPGQGKGAPGGVFIFRNRLSGETGLFCLDSWCN